MSEVAIVIPTVNYYSERRVRCETSIAEHTPPIYDLVYQEDTERRGFAHTCNRGIALALRLEPKYVLLLNDDTVVTPGWLTAMLDVMTGVQGCGLVGPMSDKVSGPQQGEPMAAPTATEVRRLVGLALLIRREVIEKIGGLDERFGLNFEDDDFCLRALAAGYRLMIARHSFVRHEGSATFKELGLDYVGTLQAAWRVFAAKWGARLTETGGYQVDVPAWDRERCYVPLPAVEVAV